MHGRMMEVCSFLQSINNINNLLNVNNYYRLHKSYTCLASRYNGLVCILHALLIKKLNLIKFSKQLPA